MQQTKVANSKTTANYLDGQIIYLKEAHKPTTLTLKREHITSAGKPKTSGFHQRTLSNQPAALAVSPQQDLLSPTACQKQLLLSLNNQNYEVEDQLPCGNQRLTTLQSPTSQRSVRN